MHDAKRQAVRFLEKEIKTYTALSLFLSKRGANKFQDAGANVVVIRPSFYKERMKEAKKLVHELRKPE